MPWIRHAPRTARRTRLQSVSCVLPSSSRLWFAIGRLMMRLAGSLSPNDRDRSWSSLAVLRSYVLYLRMASCSRRREPVVPHSDQNLMHLLFRQVGGTVRGLAFSNLAYRVTGRNFAAYGNGSGGDFESDPGPC